MRHKPESLETGERTCNRLSVLKSGRTTDRDVLTALDEVRLNHNAHDHRRSVSRLQLARLCRRARVRNRLALCAAARNKKRTMSSATSICLMCCFWLLPWLQSI